MHKDQIKAKLSKYSKADIIDAVCHAPTANYFLQSMLVYLESRESERMFDAEAKANAKAREKLEAYVQWNNEMCKKYGDGKSYSISHLPESELHKGVALGDAWKKAIDEAKRASKKVDRAVDVLSVKGRKTKR